MKKIFLIAAVVMSTLTLAGCGASSSSSSASESSSASPVVQHLKVGQSATLTNGDKKVKITVTGMRQADPNDALVTDISHNYKRVKQFVVYNYKVEALSNNIDPSTFDGSNLKLMDSKKETGIVSSNRDSIAPDKINKGESVNMSIGVGFYNAGSKAYIGVGNELWSGDLGN